MQALNINYDVLCLHFSFYCLSLQHNKNIKAMKRVMYVHVYKDERIGELRNPFTTEEWNAIPLHKREEGLKNGTYEKIEY